ncbi:hypothetical protein FRC04_004088 [Tulasnella sp. 424]|nr:hypothetical protein FRC04_004088 [Tulasnella sp. 424]KAG8967640.1 hypothetical protein FRC05_001970 [Tulasnella sp. 425]
MDISDILNLTGIPGLGAAASAVVMLEAGLNEASIYRERCKNLCTNASTLLAALDDQQKRELHNAAVKDAASEIELVCNSAYKRMQEWRRAGRVKTFLNRDEIRADLEKLEKRLELAARTFSITAQMEIVREQEFQRGFAESQKHDMEEVKGMLRSIMRNRDDLREISTLQPTEVQSIIVSVQEELQNERPRATQSPGHRQAKMELERGLLEIRKRTGILPPLADLTREVRRLGDAPFDAGMTADIWLGEWLGEQVALKALRNIGAMNEKAKNHVLREVEIWRGLQHKHVLRLYGMCYFTPFVYLVSPLAVNGNALRFLELNPEADRIKLLAGAASGLAYLHTRHPPVVHGDLRAANILVLDGGEACISDFGLARLEEVAENTTSTSLNTAGACRWMAPEIVNPELVYSSEAKRTTATDVWSFGMAAYELFTGRRPYDHRPMDVHVIQDIDKQFRHPRPRGTVENRGLSDEVWDMMSRCWSQDPVRRPKMHEVASFFGRLANRSGTGSHIRDRSWSQSSSASDAGGPSRGGRNAITPLTPSFPPVASPKPILAELPEEDEDIPWISEVIARHGSESTSPPFDKLLSPPQITPAPSSFRSPDSDRGNPYANFYPSSGSSSSHSPEPLQTSGQSIRSIDTTYTTDSGSSFHSNDRTAGPSMASSQVTTTPRRTSSGFHPSAGYSTSGSTFSRISVNEDDETPDWPTTGPFEVHLSEDGKSVDSGTLDGVLRLLALSSSSAFRDIRRAFFKIYPTFTDDGEVFDSLREQYRLAGLSEVSSQRRARIRYNIISLMRDWVEAQPLVLSNGPVSDRLRSFASSITEPDTFVRKAGELLKLLKSPEVPKPQRRLSRSTLSTHSGAGDVKWSKLTPVEIATQLTAIESQLFRDISIIDCFVYFQSSKDAGAHPVEAFREKNARVIILKCPTVEMRSDVYKRFAQVASICRKMGNFSSMSAIVVALKAVAIDRLEETKRGVSKDIHKELQETSALLDHNNRAYQKMLENYRGPVIPILHVHLQNIKYNYSSMARFIKGTSGQTLVNFKRYTKLLSRIEALLLYQDSDFRIIDNFQQMRCIDDQLRSSSVAPDPNLDRWIEKKSKEVAHKEHDERNLFSNEIARLRGGRP